jgi:hypothetical protein
MNPQVRPFLLTLGILLVCVSFSYAQTSGTWTLTGQTANSTENPAAVLLQNGKVLVAGGDLGAIILAINNAQLYDPATNSWKATGKMTAKRYGLTGTLLPNGRVLIAGGTNGGIGANGYDLNIAKTAELYDPATGKFAATGKMITKRMGHTATLLPDGRVLVVGGINMWRPRLRWYTCTPTAEIYDPATATWSSAGSMSVGRCAHGTVLLPNGRVLITGGNNYRTPYNTAEIYDPATNTWSAAGTMKVIWSTVRAKLLPNGKVLAVDGGTNAELYDPAAGTWTQTGSMAVAHSGDLVLLTSGKVLFTGGYSSGACEIYDPLSGTWSPTGSFNSVRYGAPPTLLSNGNVLVSGGGGVWWNGEVYTP